MPDYRRSRVPGGSYFFSANLRDRRAGPRFACRMVARCGEAESDDMIFECEARQIEECAERLDTQTGVNHPGEHAVERKNSDSNKGSSKTDSRGKRPDLWLCSPGWRCPHGLPRSVTGTKVNSLQTVRP